MATGSSENPSVATESGPKSKRHTVEILPFAVNDRDVDCMNVSAKDAVEMFEKKLVACCEDFGFEVVDGPGDFRIKGTICEVVDDEKALKAVLGFLQYPLRVRYGKLKAVRVYVTGSIDQEGHFAESFDYPMSFFRKAKVAPESDEIVKSMFGSIAGKISTAAARVAGDAVSETSEEVARYFRKVYVAIVAVVLLGLLGAGGWLFFNMGQDENLVSTIAMVAADLFVAGFCTYWLGLAIAPTSVLEDRSMMRFRAYSGVSKVFMLRLVLLGLGLLPLGWFYLQMTAFQD